jgi:hypothetical protein
LHKHEKKRIIFFEKINYLKIKKQFKQLKKKVHIPFFPFTTNVAKKIHMGAIAPPPPSST